jgi:hypothetical protein
VSGEPGEIGEAGEPGEIDTTDEAGEIGVLEKCHSNLLQELIGWFHTSARGVKEGWEVWKSWEKCCSCVQAN